MFLQGPYFSAEGALGLPKAKSWWEHWIEIREIKVPLSQAACNQVADGTLAVTGLFWSPARQPPLQANFFQ